MRYETCERIIDHKGNDYGLPVGARLTITSKWYNGKNGRFAAFKAPSIGNKMVWADESQLARGK